MLVSAFTCKSTNAHSGRMPPRFPIIRLASMLTVLNINTSPCNNLVIRCGASPPTMKAHNQISHEISKEEGKHSMLDFIQKMPDPLLHQLLILCCTENTTLSICAMFGCFWPAAHGYLSLISQSRISTKYTHSC